MPTRNVNLTDELDRFVAGSVESGRYENASEVVRAGLRVLEEHEQGQEAKLAALRAALEEGERSGVAEGWSFENVLKKFNLPHPTRGPRPWRISGGSQWARKHSDGVQGPGFG